MRGRLLTLTLATFSTLVASLGAQAPTASPEPRLREVARATGYGGNVRQVVISPSGSRMVSIGEEGDLLEWDLLARTLLRRIASHGRYVTAIALHPTEPWLVFCASPLGDFAGSVWRVALDTGAESELWPTYARDLQFAANGNTLVADFRDGDKWRREAFRSDSLATGPIPVTPPAVDREPPSSETSSRVQSQGTTIERLGPDPAQFDLADRLDSLIGRVTLAADGTMVASDQQGQLHVMGRTAADVATLSGHQGPVHELEFSADSCFLAMTGLGGARIVDIAGRTVEEFAGSCIVRRGPDGADFWRLTYHQLRRWNAVTRAESAPPVRWQEPQVAVLRPGSRTLLVQKELGAAQVSLWTQAPAAFPDGSWFANSNRHGARAVRWVGGAFQRLENESQGSLAVALLPIGDRGTLFLTARPLTTGTPGSGALRRYDTRGATREVATFDAHPRWLVPVGDGEHVFVGTGRTVHRVALDGLAVEDEMAFPKPILQMAAFGEERMLASTGDELLLLHHRTLARIKALQWPTGIAGIDVFAVAPDLRHVAIARGSDVRMLAID